MICREWSIVKSYGSTRTASPLLCRCWHCEYCYDLRRRDLADFAKRGRPTTFITLTVNPGRFSGPDERAQRLVDSWRLVRQTLRRRFGFQQIAFVAVMEKTEQGEPHLHILARLPYVAQRWLSRYMNKLMGAPVVDIRRVRSQQGVARYVSKYASKDPAAFQGCKRYWSSHNWLDGQPRKLEKQGPPAKYAEVWRKPAQAVATAFVTLGYGVSFDGLRWTIKEVPEGGVPPPSPPPRLSIRLRSYG